VNAQSRRDEGALSPEAARALTSCLAPRQRARAAAPADDLAPQQQQAEPKPSRHAERSPQTDENTQPESKSKLMAAAERKGQR